MGNQQETTLALLCFPYLTPPQPTNLAPPVGGYASTALLSKLGKRSGTATL